MRSSLRPHPTSPELRTVAVREGPFSMDKSHLKLVAPAEVNRIVAPTRRPNAELRTREHLTPGEVEAAKANRHGHRAWPSGMGSGRPSLSPSNGRRSISPRPYSTSGE
jgi:hypothetical protein